MLATRARHYGNGKSKGEAGRDLPRLSARAHLLGLITVAVVPVWLFAAYLLAQYAFNERDRFEREAQRVARQASLVVEGELSELLTVLQGLAKSSALLEGDLAALHAQATRLVEGTDRIILLRDLAGRQFFNTRLAAGAALPPAVPLTASERERAEASKPMVGNVYASPISGEYRIAVALPLAGPDRQRWLLAITVPTARIRDVLTPVVPSGWTIGIGDGDGNYVARSQQHEEVTGQPGLPEYVAKVVGTAGTFTSRNFQGVTLLAGYYRSDFSNWFYAANIPLSVVQAPLWRSLAAIGALALVAMGVSTALAYVVGRRFTNATAELAARAAALGQGVPAAPIATFVTEFAVIADALAAAERDLADRKSELETVLETVPAAVWFTYDPQALEVIRNRYAAELMGLPTDARKTFGKPDHVIDTIAIKDGRKVGREDRPLTRAMRGELTDNEEFAYILPGGTERTLLSSARPIRDATGRIIGAVQISLDISERKRGEEQRRLLVNELNHRVKNTLAVVQSIANQTLRNAESLPEAARALSSRLVSLAKAHDILTQENWVGADLEELADAALSPHASLGRFELSGPPVRLPPSQALSLAMAFHELATNAIKYGALSMEKGTVAIRWSVEESVAGKRLRIEWRERDGPAVSAPTRKGFGTRMLERILDPDSAGTVGIEFPPSGVVCVFELVLDPVDKPAVAA